MIILLLLPCLLALSFVGAIPGRVDQGCVLLGSSIYCYGGFKGASGGVFTDMSNDHYYADLSLFSLNTTFAMPNWVSLNPPPAGLVLENRFTPSIAALDSSRYMILGGGYLSPLTNPGLIFDSRSKSWSTLPIPPFYMSEGAMLSSDPNNVWAYGGKINGTSNPTPNAMLRFDLSTAPGKWTVQLNSQFTPPIGRYGHAMTIRDSIIYFFGGFLSLPEVNLQPNVVPFFNVSFYNTATDQWGMISASGDKPTDRKGHTATFIEGTSKVLIYGGTNVANMQSLPISDSAYTFDLDQQIFKRLNLTGGAEKRTGHSAVYYNKHVFILFGYDGSGNIRNDTSILDVSNPDAIVWAGQTSSNNSSSNPTNNSTPTNTGNSSESSFSSSTTLSTGAIAGIAVAIVLLVIVIIAAGVFFYFYRKKNNRPKNDFDYYLTPPQDFNTDIQPTIIPTNRKSNEDSPASNNDNRHLSYNTNDPVPSYPSTKPHEEAAPVPLAETQKIKPSGSD